MATGAGLLERARKHIGEDYVNIRVPKNDPNWHGPWDCAEFMSWLIFQEAGILYGCTDNNASPAQADAYTGAWQNDSKTRGIRISVDDAAATVGAILLRYPPGPGKMGHIVLSDGKGGTVEAKGKAFGVVADTVQGRRWDTGVLIPGITYGAQAAPIVVRAPSQIYAPDLPNMAKAVVSDIQRALAAKGFDPGNIAGVFDVATAGAVAKFQESLGLVADGEVGRETANALGVLLPGMKPDFLGSLLGEGTMNPLIAIAASVLPEIIKAIAGDKAGSVATEISKAVTEVTKTTDPQEAKDKLTANPAAVTELQVKLAQIAVDTEEKRQAAQLALLKEQHDEEERKRNAILAQLRANLEDTQGARNSFSALALANNPMAWGAPIVSVIVTLGFFGILSVLILNGIKVGDGHDQVAQIINITVGALAAAFATVVSFWLGSSQGSRVKDAASFQLQTDQAKQTSEVIKSQTQQADAVLKSGVAQAANKPATTDQQTSNFSKCLDVVLVQEGGYSNHPNDPGGPTNMGITLGVLKEWRSDNSLTAADVQNLARDEAREIYRTKYWNLMKCDELPRGVDLVVFDFGVNAGPSRSAKILQKIVGAETDGSIGPVTTGACKVMPAKDIITQMSKARMDYYQTSPNWPTFGNGWTNRTRAVEDAALAMAV
jgi:peptidoglycan hydrolase-like protein with peptidoglycan-binding domain